MRQPPRLVSVSCSKVMSKGASTGASVWYMPKIWPACSCGPFSRGIWSWSTSPTFASNTSPKVLTRRDSLSSPQYAAACCSCSTTRKRLGNSRRTTALRTQGTASKAALVAFRSTVKKVPLILPPRLARSVTSLLCTTSPTTEMPRMANTGWCAAHCTSATSPRTSAPRNSTVVVAFMSFTSMGAATLGMVRPWGFRSPALRFAAGARTGLRS